MSGRSPKAPGLPDDLPLAQAEAFMQEALGEARRGVGRTSPNPPVGAVVVKDGWIIGRGYHARVGLPHAEVGALAEAGEAARGADLYVTLEPCDHYGRTPPCTRAILEAGIARVFFGAADPNPEVNGKGMRRLKRGGVVVHRGVLGEACEALVRPYVKRVRTGLPWLTLKAAASLDGRIATAKGDSRWVTGPAARARVHVLRDQADAVLVGRATAALDDPRLTTRLPGGGGRDPLRVVVDSGLSLPTTLALFNQRSSARTVVATLADPDGRKARALTARGVEIWKLRAAGGGVSPRALLQRLASAGVNHVLCEGGGQLAGSLLAAGLVDELQLFLAPKLVGSDGRPWLGPLGLRRMAQAPVLRELSVEPVDGDWLLRGLL